MNVKRVLKYEVARKGPTMLPKGCELPDPSPARIVAVGIQLEPDAITWREVVVVWVEVTYPYENGGLPGLELVPVNLRAVTTGTEVGCVGAEYVGTGQIQHDRINNGAPLVLHVYRCATVKVEMHGAGPPVESQRFVGDLPGAGLSPVRQAQLAAEQLQTAAPRRRA